MFQYLVMIFWETEEGQLWWKSHNCRKKKLRKRIWVLPNFSNIQYFQSCSGFWEITEKSFLSLFGIVCVICWDSFGNPRTNDWFIMDVFSDINTELKEIEKIKPALHRYWAVYCNVIISQLQILKYLFFLFFFRNTSTIKNANHATLPHKAFNHFRTENWKYISICII